MKIKDLVKKNVKIAKNDITVFDAAQQMEENNIGAIIVGNKDHIEGVFSENDLLTKVIAKGLSPEKTKLNEVMTKKVITVNINQDTREVLKLMSEKKIKHLPVVDIKGKCIGIISARDLLKAMLDIIQNENNTLIEYILAVEKVKSIIEKRKINK